MKIKQVALVGLCLLLAACGGVANHKPLSKSERPDEVADRVVKNYTIGVDDVVSVSVWRNPDLSVEVPVRPDGKISVPLVGDVTAGGLTPQQVAKIIEKRLSKFIRSPRVAVILTELASHEFISRVRVTGAVEKPLSIPHRQGMTVLDLVLEAGGLNDFAAPGRAKLFRKQEGSQKSFPVYLDSIIDGGDLDTNYTLRPGDVISVPERRF